MRSSYPEGTRFQFDSTRKRIATIVDDKNLPYPKRLYTKGASETILENCTHYLEKDGNEQPISDTLRNELLGTINIYAKQALRTIGLAYRDLSDGMGGPLHDNKSEANPHLHEIEEVADGARGFTLIGIAGIMDIIRPAVPGAVLTCMQAGVRVRMVTGDNLVTAKAIA
jgi:Ca2+-transporting ATPase